MSRIREISLVMFVGLLSGCPKPDPAEPPKPEAAAAAPAAASGQPDWDQLLEKELYVDYVGCDNGVGGPAEHCHLKLAAGETHTADLSGGSGKYGFVMTTKDNGTLTCQELTVVDGELTGDCVIAEADLVGSPDHKFRAVLRKRADDESKVWMEVHFEHPGAPDNTKAHDGSAHVHPKKPH